MKANCPQCNSKAFKRNGYTRHGKQNHRCLDCGRQFSHEPLEFHVTASHYEDGELALAASTTDWRSQV